MDDPETTKRLIDGALAGDRAKLRQLVDTLSVVIQQRVVRTLRRYGGAARGRSLQQEVDDLVQQVWERLLEKQGRALRNWQPERGTPLAGYVRMIATREVVTILRSRTRSPFTEDPVDGEVTGEIADVASSSETVAISRDLLHRLVGELRRRLSLRDEQIFELLVLEDHSVEDLCTTLQTTPAAVYASRYRITKVINDILQDLRKEPTPRLESVR